MMEMNLPPDLQEDMSGYSPLATNQDWRLCHKIVKHLNLSSHSQ